MLLTTGLSFQYPQNNGFLKGKDLRESTCLEISGGIPKPTVLSEGSRVRFDATCGVCRVDTQLVGFHAKEGTRVPASPLLVES